MKRSAMNDVHNIHKIALTSYANHQLQNLQNQYGIGQGSTTKKL